jgi:hypothetical protein
MSRTTVAFEKAADDREGSVIRQVAKHLVWRAPTEQVNGAHMARVSMPNVDARHADTKRLRKIIVELDGDDSTCTLR